LQTNNRNSLNNRLENGNTYKFHMYDGKLHRVPKDWRIPRCNTMSLWRQWLIGDDEKQIPPLRVITYMDFKHLDDVPLSDFEKTAKPGPKAVRNRRNQSKVWSDLRYLMNYIMDLVKEEVQWQKK
jgi:hypothetical protein